jgi:uncharacterized membrane protein YhaH (DUF805 family)
MLAILPIIGSLVDSGSILESFVSIVGSFAFIRMIILCVKRGHDLNMS